MNLLHKQQNQFDKSSKSSKRVLNNVIIKFNLNKNCLSKDWTDRLVPDGQVVDVPAFWRGPRKSDVVSDSVKLR